MEVEVKGHGAPPFRRRRGSYSRIGGRTLELEERQMSAVRSMRDRRWSLSVPLDGFTLAEHAELAREAERLGYTDAWSLEVDGVDCFAPLAVVGLATRLRVGTAIANVYTRGPATLALSAAGIAEIAPGRFCLGIGSGSQPPAQAWDGRALPPPPTPPRETAQVLPPARAGGRGVFRGETFAGGGLLAAKTPA